MSIWLDLSDQSTVVSPQFSSFLFSCLRCDFSTLSIGILLTDPVQSATLARDCGFTVRTVDPENKNIMLGRPINVFDSANPKSDDRRDDPDLGAPNRACPSGGPGKGRGGKVRIQYGSGGMMT